MGTVENWRLSQGGGLPLQLQLISASWGLELKVARSSESFFCFAFFFSFNRNCHSDVGLANQPADEIQPSTCFHKVLLGDNQTLLLTGC